MTFLSDQAFAPEVKFAGTRAYHFIVVGAIEIHHLDHTQVVIEGDEGVQDADERQPPETDVDCGSE